MNVYLADETHIAVIEQRPTGFGPNVWIGELRTLANDEPVTAWAIDHIYVNQRPGNGVGAKHCQPLSVGTSEAQVLALLVARAREIKEAA